MLANLQTRISSRVVVNDSGCWEWQGMLDRYGYGRAYLPVSVMRRKAKIIEAHRLSYLLYVGDIPSGLQIDHLCRNKKCVNPQHLEPVTAKENNRRTTGIRKSVRARSDAKDYFCKRGHLMTVDTTYKNGNGRSCKACLKLRQQSYRGADK